MFKRILLVTISMIMVRSSHSYYDDYFLPDQGPHEDKSAPLPDYNDNGVSDMDKPTGFTCGLCIVVDEVFSDAYNLKDGASLKSSLAKLVDHASWIFRTSDWDGDGRPDNIGFKPIKISIGWMPYRHETPEHYETPRPSLELLKVFARLNFTKCCLGVGFTNRPFVGDQDGVSFAGSDRLLGGICDHRNPREDFMTSMNVVLISGRGYNGSQLTSYQIAKAFVHELGHAFGAFAHDHEYKDPECWGFRAGEEPKAKNSIPQDGRYVMWATSSFANAPLKRNTLAFSKCAKSAIRNVVGKRKNRHKCFDLDYNPFCGNGIVEGIEMCDCGNEYQCSLQKCCGSRKSNKPCMLADDKACPAGALANVNNLKQYAVGHVTYPNDLILVSLTTLISFCV